MSCFLFGSGGSPHLIFIHFSERVQTCLEMMRDWYRDLAVLGSHVWGDCLFEMLSSNFADRPDLQSRNLMGDANAKMCLSAKWLWSGPVNSLFKSGISRYFGFGRSVIIAQSRKIVYLNGMIEFDFLRSIGWLSHSWVSFISGHLQTNHFFLVRSLHFFVFLLLFVFVWLIFSIFFIRASDDNNMRWESRNSWIEISTIRRRVLIWAEDPLRQVCSYGAPKTRMMMNEYSLLSSVAFAEWCGSEAFREKTFPIQECSPNHTKWLRDWLD
jgi:hypothetical protein